MYESSTRVAADRAVSITWLVLVSCTVVSWTESPAGRPSPAVTLIILLLTMVKVALIMASFMEIAHAPRWLQALCGTWVGVVFTGLAVGLLTLPA